MSTTTATLPGTAADDSAVGSLTWANPDNIKLDNGSYATAFSSGANQTHYLKATNFGFSIPGGATVDGIEVKIERKSLEGVPPDTAFDNAVKLVDGDGNVVGDNKADANEWASADEVITYGGAGDDWNAGLDDTDINNSNFGVVLTADLTRAFGSGITGYIDYITVEVTYTAAAPSGGTSINIGDSWKEVAAMKINIGDTWKAVAAAKINIGGSWKAVDFA